MALRFSRHELRALLDLTGFAALPEAELDDLEQRTEGWIAGVKLATSPQTASATEDSLAADPVRASLASPSTRRLTGSIRAVAEFFSEEVMAGLAPSMKNFLTKTSVLKRLHPDLCKSVANTADARRIIDMLESSGLFLLPTDDEGNWHRYHPLFQEFLRHRLEKESTGAAAALLRRASDWCLDQSLHVDAIDYALQAGEPARAAQILEQCCVDLTYEGQIGVVVGLAEQIPDAVLQRYPAILLTWAWLLTRNLRLEEAKKMVNEVRARLATDSDQRSAAEQKRLNYLLLHRDMTLAAGRDDPELVERLSLELIDDFPEEVHPYLTGTNYAQLIYARREQYQLKEIDELAARAQGTLSRSGYSFAVIAVQPAIGISLFEAGKADAAIAALEAGLAEARRFERAGRSEEEGAALAALPGLPLSAILYERNDIARAEGLQARLLEHATVYGFVDQLLAGYITRARLLFVADNSGAALRVIEDGLTIALDRGLERLRLGLVAERIRLLMRLGATPRQLAQIGKSAAIPQRAAEVMPITGITSLACHQAMSWIRIAQSQGNVGEAVKVARQWRNFCGNRNAALSFIRWNVELVRLQAMSGDARAAQRSLREAVAAAAPMRAIRTIVDEGAVIRTLLASAQAPEPVSNHSTDRFALELLQVFDANGKSGRLLPVSTETPVKAAAMTPVEAPVVEGLYGELTTKEVEILTLVSVGMSNREVAVKLGLTEGSIKWYMQLVFDKLGARRRVQAVARARQLGLIK